MKYGVSNAVGESRPQQSYVSVCVLLLVGLEKGDNGHVTKLGTAVKDGNFKNEQIADQIAAQLLDQGGSSRSRTTCWEHISVT